MFWANLGRRVRTHPQHLSQSATPLRDQNPRTPRQVSDFCVRAFDTEAIKDHGHQETRARVLDRPAEADERALWCPCCVTLGESSALWSLISPLDNEGIRDDFYGPFGSILL